MIAIVVLLYVMHWLYELRHRTHIAQITFKYWEVTNAFFQAKCYLVDPDLRHDLDPVWGNHVRTGHLFNYYCCTLIMLNVYKFTKSQEVTLEFVSIKMIYVAIEMSQRVTCTLTISYQQSSHDNYLVTL